MCDSIKEPMNLRRRGSGEQKKLEEEERMKMIEIQYSCMKFSKISKQSFYPEVAQQTLKAVRKNFMNR